MRPVKPDSALSAVVGTARHPPHRAHQEALGVHQAERPAGHQESPRDQRRRQASSGLRRQVSGHDVRHDQARQQAPQLVARPTRPNRGTPAGAPFFVVSAIFPALWPANTSSRCATSGRSCPPPARSSRASTSPSTPAPRSACSAANGAGKSTLLRIMAGVDNDFLGDARPLPGTRIGYLPQEPQLDPRRTCAATSRRP